MGKRLALRIGNVSLSVVLNDTPAAEAVLSAAPFEASAHRWGQEIFFATPLADAAGEADAETVAAGEVGFWPPGRALCLFYGPTPLSVGDEIRPASPVKVVGHIEDIDALAALDEVTDGDLVAVAAGVAGN